ncbi:hypothetical protein [Paraburkholderia sp. C35]|nr:hypothetical protein [Paraburkholderia sp. C35]
MLTASIIVAIVAAFGYGMFRLSGWSREDFKNRFKAEYPAAQAARNE